MEQTANLQPTHALMRNSFHDDLVMHKTGTSAIALHGFVNLIGRERSLLASAAPALLSADALEALSRSSAACNLAKLAKLTGDKTTKPVNINSFSVLSQYSIPPKNKRARMDDPKFSCGTSEEDSASSDRSLVERSLALYRIQKKSHGQKEIHCQRKKQRTNTKEKNNSHEQPDSCFNLNMQRKALPLPTKAKLSFEIPSQQALLHQKQPSKSYCTPCDNDVLLGRGRGHVHHLGNYRLRLLADAYRKIYVATGRENKWIHADRICQIIYATNGRFLRYVDSNGASQQQQWEAISNIEARKKVGHAIRDSKKRSMTRDEYNLLAELPLLPPEVLQSAKIMIEE